MLKYLIYGFSLIKFKVNADFCGGFLYGLKKSRERTESRIKGNQIGFKREVFGLRLLLGVFLC